MSNPKANCSIDMEKVIIDKKTLIQTLQSKLAY